ncbi:MAG: beta-propeller domain-containing protein [Polyangiaceae bacterium]
MTHQRITQRWVTRAAAITTTALLTMAPACLREGNNDSLSAIRKHPARKTLTAFSSDADLKAFLDKHKKAAPKGYPAGGMPGMASPSSGAEGAPAQAAPASPAASADAKESQESITNTQHANVDEGGIVKMHKDLLVVLRRGRLFTVKIGDGSMTPVSSSDAFGSDIDPSGTWYDEMLLSDHTIAVIGYSYARGGTEVGLFNLSDEGKISYRATYHLRSNDYYSSRNYASRLIGDKLIFYTPLYISPYVDDPLKAFPAIRKWHSGAKDDEFKRIASSTHIYRSDSTNAPSALHTVTICDVSKPELSCEATGILGPAGRVFYVSPSSVFVWTNDWFYDDPSRRPRSESQVFRLPLDGSAPSTLKAAGSPVDQFSFLESNDGFLNVVVRAEGNGEAMWGSEITAGDVALMRVSLESFSDGETIPSSAYRKLPKPEGYTFQNRFVGSHLLYGTGSSWGRPQNGAEGKAWAVPFAGGDVTTLPLRHGVDRIEAMGNAAVLIGTNGQDLSFTPVSLQGRPTTRTPYVRKDASQGELRSHGFFYKPESQETGMLGLPIRGGGLPGADHLVRDSASILFLKNDALSFSEMGNLGSESDGSTNDACRASCVDWYGNARPIFAKNRVFALLGYELVEGEVSGGKIREKRRVSFAPGAKEIAR